ncbi:hypothetical protein JOC34_000114 [Virgibacillus halotolerans]|nr:hypothetical protein [Virgibacillus halotolerans]
MQCYCFTLEQTLGPFEITKVKVFPDNIRYHVLKLDTDTRLFGLDDLYQQGWYRE